jgi:ArsR family transcriptional regulator
MAPLLQQIKALADKTRLDIFDLLMERELAVGEIVEILDMGQSRVSRHLKILHDAELLTSRRDGLWAFYRVNREASLPEVLAPLMERDPEVEESRRQREKGLEESRKKNRAWFDSLAGRLPAVKYELLGETGLEERMVELLRPLESLADLGCGTGELFDALLTKAQKVIGVDRSEAMLAEAARRRDPERVDLRIGSLDHLPLLDGEAEGAVISMVLHYLADPALALAEVGRVVRSGGQFLLADLLSHDDEEMRKRYGHRRLGFSREEIARWLKEAGFQIEKEESFDARRGLTVVLFSSKRI